MKAEAKEGSFPPTTGLLARLFPTPEALELSACSASSPKWASTSSMVSAESGSKEIGGISNSSSPRQGVWNVFYNKKINNVNINWYIINTWVNIKITPILFFTLHTDLYIEREFRI